MLYKLDKKGCVVNEASLELVQPYYKKILREISSVYQKNLGGNLLSVYVRGSVSVGRARFGVSDVDTIAVTKKKLPREKMMWIVNSSKILEKKYPQAGFFDLTVVSLGELKNSKNYKNLRVYLKTQSFLLDGVDILSQLPNITPGKALATQLYGNLPEELAVLKGIFDGKIKEKEYLFQKRPIEFWCVWMTRVMLRAGLGVLMAKRPVYSQDLKTCCSLFTKEYPQYGKQMRQLLKWSVNPIGDKKTLSLFLYDFAPEFLKLWQKNIMSKQ